MSKRYGPLVLCISFLKAFNLIAKIRSDSNQNTCNSAIASFAANASGRIDNFDSLPDSATTKKNSGEKQFADASKLFMGIHPGILLFIDSSSDAINPMNRGKRFYANR